MRSYRGSSTRCLAAIVALAALPAAARTSAPTDVPLASQASRLTLLGEGGGGEGFPPVFQERNWALAGPGIALLGLGAASFVALLVEGLVAFWQVLEAWAGGPGPSSQLGVAAIFSAIGVPVFVVPGAILLGVGLRNPPPLPRAPAPEPVPEYTFPEYPSRVEAWRPRTPAELAADREAKFRAAAAKEVTERWPVSSCSASPTVWKAAEGHWSVEYCGQQFRCEQLGEDRVECAAEPARGE